MAKNDYHVIVCKILKYLYSCLKAGATPEADKLIDIIGDLPGSYADYIVEALHKEGYVEGTYPETASGKEKVQLNESTMITPKGIEYLNDNRYMLKVREYLDRN